MRLLVTGGLPIANGLIGVGGEIAWPRPTRPGDVLKVESEIVEIRPSRSKPNQGIVSIKSVMESTRGRSAGVDGEDTGVPASAFIIDIWNSGSWAIQD